MKRSYFVVGASIVALGIATSADAAICSLKGNLFKREQCRARETQVSQLAICAKKSGNLLPRSECRKNERLALEGLGDVCANPRGKVFQREACRSKEHVIARPSLCAARNGKLLLAEDCKPKEAYLGSVALHPLVPQSRAIGSGPGPLGFTCSGGVCECHGTEDCNDMFSTNVCDDTLVQCCDAYYPETCRCGDIGWCATRASAGSTVAHETTDHVFPKPLYGSYRLDWCESWATGCGKPAADRFCRRHYGENAVAFKYSLDAGIGHITPTLTQKDRQLCTESFCGGFESITCRAPATAVYRPDGLVVPNPPAQR